MRFFHGVKRISTTKNTIKQKGYVLLLCNPCVQWLINGDWCNKITAFIADAAAPGKELLTDRVKNPEKRRAVDHFHLMLAGRHRHRFKHPEQALNFNRLPIQAGNPVFGPVIDKM